MCTQHKIGKKRNRVTIPPASLRRAPSSVPVAESPHEHVEFAEMLLDPRRLKALVDRALLSGMCLVATVREHVGTEFVELKHPRDVLTLLTEGQIYAAQLRYELGGVSHIDTLIVTRYGVRYVHVPASS